MKKLMSQINQYIIGIIKAKLSKIWRKNEAKEQ